MWKSALKMLKKRLQLLKKFSLTSFQVIGRGNDRKMVYVSNLAKKINSGNCISSGFDLKNINKNYELNHLIS